MPNYRYVSQGEFYITTDSETTLVTSGMTECIAFAFIDKENPSLRLLAHLDGQILATPQVALANISHLKTAFQEKTGSLDFEVHLLGGQLNRHNYRMLIPALEKLNLTMTECVDITKFCSTLNVHRSRFTQFSPMTVNATFICKASLTPELISFNKNHFSPPLSEDELINGDGLEQAGEKDEYLRFLQVNEAILSNDLAASQSIRTSADTRWVKEYEESHQITSDKKYE
ncbi:hypothetical protein [Legionella cardiaca]|uniref:Uncharacterized protein n=1 Tax=Legionella cardiaca TaxID=1071983 RepID=A0ABY8AP11_9GAMM|nr:hypothetical protein [Legionella cardiaca]WED42283.1 hypothetical protein PXX05_10125 [Legionella cardiaca]